MDFMFGSTEHESVQSAPPETNRWISDRPLWTTENKTVHVDPVAGSDGAEGTADDPLATITEAFDRMPSIIYHTYHIVLESGTYSEPYRDMPPTFTSAKPHNPPVEIRGATGNRDDVIIENEIYWSMIHGEQDIAQFRDVTIDGTVGVKFGNVRFENVNFRGQAGILGGVAISIHSPFAYVKASQCDFSSNYENGIKLANGGRTYLENVSGHPQHYGVHVSDNATVTFGGSTANFWGELGRYFSRRESVVRHRSRIAQNNPRLYDDFGDGAAEDRLNPTMLAGYRPEWVSWTGFSASDGQLELTADQLAYLKHGVTRGTFWTEFNFETAPASGQYIFRFLEFNGTTDTYQVRVKANGGIDLQRVEGGSITTTISGGTWPVDTESHRVEVVRDGTGHELRFDGATVGTDASPWVPASKDEIWTEQRNAADTQVNITEFGIEQNN